MSSRQTTPLNLATPLPHPTPTPTPSNLRYGLLRPSETPDDRPILWNPYQCFLSRSTLDTNEGLLCIFVNPDGQCCRAQISKDRLIEVIRYLDEISRQDPESLSANEVAEFLASKILCRRAKRMKKEDGLPQPEREEVGHVEKAKVVVTMNLREKMEAFVEERRRRSGEDEAEEAVIQSVEQDVVSSDGNTEGFMTPMSRRADSRRTVSPTSSSTPTMGAMAPTSSNVGRIETRDHEDIAEINRKVDNALDIAHQTSWRVKRMEMTAMQSTRSIWARLGDFVAGIMVVILAFVGLVVADMMKKNGAEE